MGKISEQDTNELDILEWKRSEVVRPCKKGKTDCDKVCFLLVTIFADAATDVTPRLIFEEMQMAAAAVATDPPCLPGRVIICTH